MSTTPDSRVLVVHTFEPISLATVSDVPIKLENVAIAVRDLEAAISFFTDLGLSVLGRDTVSGEWTETAVGLDGNHAKIAMLQTPDGTGRLRSEERRVGKECRSRWSPYH